MLFTLGKHQSDYLIKSDFNSYTCLCVNKIFENSFVESVSSQRPFLELRMSKTCQTSVVRPFQQQNAQKKRPSCDKLNTGSWSSVLNLYFNIQTLLLSNLKYKYLKDSTLFFGSYYDHMLQVRVSGQATRKRSWTDTVQYGYRTVLLQYGTVTVRYCYSTITVRLQYGYGYSTVTVRLRTDLRPDI